MGGDGGAERPGHLRTSPEYPQMHLPGWVGGPPLGLSSIPTPDHSGSHSMTGRPVVRTVTLNPDSRELFHEIFGSSGHAFKHIGAGMTYSVFRRAWDGKQVTPQIVESLEGSWSTYWSGLVARLSSAA